MSFLLRVLACIKQLLDKCLRIGVELVYSTVTVHFMLFCYMDFIFQVQAW